MRFKHILYTGACFGLLMAPTIAAEEGFVFTEEDVAAAEEEANKLADNKALMRFNESYAKFRGNIAVNAYKFFERFHNELNQDERETLYNEMTLNAPNGEMCKYIRMKEGSCIWRLEDFSKLKPGISGTWSENQNTFSANMQILS